MLAIAKKFLEPFKDYLSFLLLTPTIIGGLFQLIELSLISLSYIRFYSITQAFVDGLLFLFILVSLGFIVSILIWVLNTKKDPKNVNRSKLAKVLHHLKLHLLHPFLIILFLSVYFRLFSGMKYDWLIFIIYIPVSITLLFYPISIIQELLKKVNFFNKIATCFGEQMANFILYKEHGKVENNSEKSISFKFRRKRIFLIFLTFIFFYYGVFRDKLIKPESLYNQDFIECYLGSYFPEQENRIRYFNDKYIFVDIIKSETESRTFVIKFDKFFQDSLCNKETSLTIGSN